MYFVQYKYCMYIVEWGWWGGEGGFLLSCGFVPNLSYD